MLKFLISSEEAKKELNESGALFKELFTHGSLTVEIYKPDKVDHQQPHTRDEIYVIIQGNGVFSCGGEKASFNQGDFLFVPAGVEHRFEEFSENFQTWVFFYGPIGGEN